MSFSTPASYQCLALLDPKLDDLRSFRGRSHFWIPNYNDTMALRDENFKKFNSRTLQPVPTFDVQYAEHVFVGSLAGNDEYFSVEGPVFHHAHSRSRKTGEKKMVIGEPNNSRLEFLKWFFVVVVIIALLLSLGLLRRIFGSAVTFIATVLALSYVWSYARKWLEAEDEFSI